LLSCEHRSKYIGVTHDKRSGGWLCRVKQGKKLFYVGYFDSEVDAALAHDLTAKKLYPGDRIKEIKINFYPGHPLSENQEMPKKKSNRGPRRKKQVLQHVKLEIKEEDNPFRPQLDTNIPVKNYNTRSRVKTERMPMVNNLLEIGNAPAESEDEDPVWEPTKALTFETMRIEEKQVDVASKACDVSEPPPALEPEHESKIGSLNKVVSATDAEAIIPTTSAEIIKAPVEAIKATTTSEGTTKASVGTEETEK